MFLRRDVHHVLQVLEHPELVTAQRGVEQSHGHHFAVGFALLIVIDGLPFRQRSAVFDGGVGLCWLLFFQLECRRQANGQTLFFPGEHPVCEHDLDGGPEEVKPVKVGTAGAGHIVAFTCLHLNAFDGIAERQAPAFTLKEGSNGRLREGRLSLHSRCRSVRRLPPLRRRWASGCKMR